MPRRAPPPAIRMDPVAAAHRSRRGRGVLTREGGQPQYVGLECHDINAVLRPGWLPGEDDLPTDFEGISELRAEHERHLKQRNDAGTAVANLKEQYEQEDVRHASALQAAYAEGTSLKIKDQRTPAAAVSRLFNRPSRMP